MSSQSMVSLYCEEPCGLPHGSSLDRKFIILAGLYPAFQSSVLNSKKAISVNIEIMVTFIKMRHYVISKNDTNEQIAELRKLLMLYVEKNDKRVNEIIIVLNNLIEHPPKTRTIGFTAEN